MNILLVYPEFPDTFWSFKHAVKFVGKKVANPPLGLVTVAAMLPQSWAKRLVDLNISPLKKTDLDWADLVFLSAMDVQRKSVKEVIAVCKENGKKIVAGGPLFTAESECFPDVDHFVLNEGEITLPQFLADLATDTAQKVYRTDQYPDIRQTPVPQWNLLDLGNYDCMSIQFSRGCPFNCDFCNVTALLGHIPRTKSAEQIINELDSLYKVGWRRNIFMVDDNFIGNKKIIKQEVLPAIIEWRKDKTGCNFITEASINLADDPELMDKMVRAGFESVFIGIETPDEESLTECNKTQNKHRDLLASVKRIQNAGLQVMGGFIVGFDNDKPTIFERQADFIQQSGIVTAMVGILQAPFGTKLYERIKSEGRLLDEISGDNGDGSTNIIPKMDPVVLREGFAKLIHDLFSPELFYARVKTCLREYRPPHSNVQIHLQEILALFRTIWLIGILGKERKQYWNLFFWTLFKFPQKFPLAITFTVYGYHFQKVSELQSVASAAQKKLASLQERGLSPVSAPSYD
jgi:radical SAM superfamily enzyme YgiQ (UPF0313 family)